MSALDGMHVLYRVPGHSGLRTGTILATGDVSFIIEDERDKSHWKIPFDYVIPTTKEGIMAMKETPLAHDIRTASSPAFIAAHFWTFVQAHWDDQERWYLGKAGSFMQEQDIDEAPTA